MESKTMISFSSENSKGDCPGSLSGDITKSRKGLIVLQEWWGMNEQIRNQALDLATKRNFITLVPDLYRGKCSDDREEAGHLMAGLDWMGAVKDIQGAAKYLISKGCAKVGVTGFCMGGALSLAAAALVPEISASAPFYGIPSPDLCDVTKITIPVQGHFAELDNLVGFSSPKDAQELKRKCDAANVPLTLYIYEGVDHGFNHVGGPNYNEEFSTLALKRMSDFMSEHL
ncbi:unnamed protein product [Owenia fusiformis]|uniref:Uncharacterized protein n=1 Tax=Owenia fusiformis TaxID=6347 RepID=A0A8J1TIB9_OWEFU|nr:unnamed protein product [Owenia fusiformis]